MEFTEHVQPRFMLERALRDMWEELLQCGEIGVLDNFFDLGGTSLSALRFIDSLHKDIGYSLDLGEFFRAPTIASVASLLRCSVADAENPRALVPIRAEHNGAPIFCIHHAGGTVISYFALARTVAADRAVYGLQSIGLSGTQRAQDSIAGMASTYLNEIESLHASGPAQVVGYSTGGIVAFEIARRMLARTGQRPLLAIIDTHTSLVSDSDEFDIISAIVQFATTTLKLDIHRDGFSGLDTLSALHRLRALGAMNGRFDSDFLIERLRCMVETIKANIHAVRNYVLQPYDGEAILFRSAEHDRDDDLGWGNYVKTLTVRQLNGGHQSALDEQNSRKIAGTLADYARLT